MASVAVSPQFGSPGEVAKLTGLSERTIRRLYSSGRLRAQKLNRRVLIDFGEALALIRDSPREVAAAVAVAPSLTADGRAAAYTEAESRARAGAALAALADGDGDDDAGQVAGWGDLRDALATNRGDG